MSRDKYNMLQYTVALVSEFSAHFGTSQRQALNYLVRFKGLTHMEEFYNILHTCLSYAMARKGVRMQGCSGLHLEKDEYKMTPAVRKKDEELTTNLKCTIGVLMRFGFNQ